MTRLTRFVLRHRRWVLAFWLVVLFAGFPASGAITDRLSGDFSLPDEPGYETSTEILETYGSGGLMAPLVAVVHLPSGSEEETVEAAEATFAAVQEAVPQVRVVDYANTGDEVFLGRDGRTSYALLLIPIPENFGPGFSPAVAAALAESTPPGATTRLTGLDELAAAGSEREGPGVLAETLLGGLGALVVLAFVFASLLALVPLVTAVVAILTTFLILFGLTYLTDVNLIVQFLVALVGLGVAIDYALLIITRWREERASGRDNEDAVVVAMQTAGRAVVFSGVTVGVSLLALILIPVPFMRSIGFAGMLIPLVSILVALTVLPAMLGGIGPRIDWPRIRREDTASRSWSAWARLVVRRRWIAGGVGLALLGLLVVPFLDLQIGRPTPESLSNRGPAYEGSQLLERAGVPTGVMTPIEILVRGDATAARAVADRVADIDGVVATVVPEGPAGSRNGMTEVIAIPTEATVNASTTAVVDRVQEAMADEPDVVGVSGAGAQQTDFLNAVYGNFPLVLLVVLLLTFLLLARAFRSLLLPLKAVLLTLVSLAAAFGGVVLFWQYGYGSEAVYDIPQTGGLFFWIPVMVFAFLFGLSMDYEVFILARMREEYDATGSTDTAVVQAIGRTGRLVTSAALILFLTFVAMASGPLVDLKIFATALGFGILLDATVVRALLVPAVVSLFGRWNWWLPGWAAWLLRVPPSPLDGASAAHHRSPAAPRAAADEPAAAGGPG